MAMIRGSAEALRKKMAIAPGGIVGVTILPASVRRYGIDARANRQVRLG
jgi:hypothetical protein